MTFYERLMRMKVKSRLKAAFRRKPRPSRIIQAGEEIHSDKGYELSTHEKYEEFAAKRNYPLEDK